MSGIRDTEIEDLVSVIITTYGDASPLPHAIDSALCQSYPCLEILVIDDNGKESPMQRETAGMIAPYLADKRLHYIVHDENKNGAAARNTGIRSARGDYITFLDNDDLMLPKRIEHAVDALRRSGADACFADVLVMKEHYAANLLEVRMSGLCWKNPLFIDGCMGTGSNMFLTRRGIDQTGYFDVSFVRNQDVEYMIRYLTRFKAVSTGELALIKGVSDTDNAPSFAKMKQVKNHLELVFSDRIANLNASDLLAYKVGREKSLLYVAKTSGDKQGVRETLDNLKKLNVSIRLLSLGECYFRVYCQRLSRFARRIVWHKKHVANLKKLDEEVIAMIPD